MCSHLCGEFLIVDVDCCSLFSVSVCYIVSNERVFKLQFVTFILTIIEKGSAHFISSCISHRSETANISFKHESICYLYI